MADKKKIKITKKKVTIKVSPQKKAKRQMFGFLKNNKIYVFGFIGIVLFGIVLFSFISLDDNNAPNQASNLAPIEQPKAEKKVAEKPKPRQRKKVEKVKSERKSDFDFPDVLPEITKKIAYQNDKEIIVEDISLEDFLYDLGINNNKREEIISLAEEMNLRKFKTRRAFYTFETEDQEAEVKRFYLYEMAPDSFVSILVYPEVDVQLRKIPVVTKLVEFEGVVDDDFFWKTFMDNGGNYELIPEILNAFKWQIDFYHVLLNDQYKLIFEENFVNGKSIGIGKLLAIYYKQKNKKYYAFLFEDEEGYGYFDDRGKVMKKKFLRSPVKNNIINSGYNKDRIHPVKKINMPHLGTDYFAMLNDEVYAVADGVVTIAGNKKNNGNYVKIKHDDIYETQYLHFNKFANGIKRGTKVKQGDVIGYAGQTGLATGVHVCFRFWKNGKQVDPTQEEVFEDDQTAKRVNDYSAFREHRDSLIKRLDRM